MSTSFWDRPSGYRGASRSQCHKCGVATTCAGSRNDQHQLPLQTSAAPVAWRRASGTKQFVGAIPTAIASGVMRMSAGKPPSTNGSGHQDVQPRSVVWAVTASGSDASDVGHAPDAQTTRYPRTVLIVDDCRLFRENLAAALALNGIGIPRVAWDLPSLVSALEEAETHIVLLNMATRGIELLLRAAIDINPDIRVIALGVTEDAESDIIACAEAGVAAYHMRSDSLDDLLALIDSVATGSSSCPPRVSAVLLRRLSTMRTQSQSAPRELALTERETQILRMLGLGRSNRDIAVQLRITVHTVKNHVHSLLTKLGVSTRGEAAALAHTIRVGRGSPRRSRS